MAYHPEAFNSFLSCSNLVKGCTLIAEVKQQEDKGYLLELSLQDKSTGFLSYTDSASRAGKKHELGKRIEVTVKSANTKTKIITCVETKSINNPEEYVLKLNSISIECVKPGMLVRGKTTQTFENGVKLEFLGGMEGLIFSDHLGKPLEKYKKNDKLIARVISVTKQRIFLSEK